MPVNVVDAQDVGCAVVALDLDVAVVRSEPLIDRLDDADPRPAPSLAGAQQTQAPAPAPAAPAPSPAPAAPAPQAAPAAPAPSPPTAPAPAPTAQPAPAVVPPVPASTPDQEKLRLLQTKRYPGKVHVLPATLETTQWGWFNNAQPPVLHVDSGDTILFETMMHSHNQVVPGVTIEQIKKLRTDFPGRGPHTMTGPVYIEGAEPGDVLRVHINKIVPRAYATNCNVPGMFGAVPLKFPEG